MDHINNFNSSHSLLFRLLVLYVRVNCLIFIDGHRKINGSWSRRNSLESIGHGIEVWEESSDSDGCFPAIRYLKALNFVPTPLLMSQCRYYSNFSLWQDWEAFSRNISQLNLRKSGGVSKSYSHFAFIVIVKICFKLAAYQDG